MGNNISVLFPEPIAQTHQVRVVVVVVVVVVVMKGAAAWRAVTKFTLVHWVFTPVVFSTRCISSQKFLEQFLTTGNENLLVSRVTFAKHINGHIFPVTLSIKQREEDFVFAIQVRCPTVPKMCSARRCCCPMLPQG